MATTDDLLDAVDDVLSDGVRRGMLQNHAEDTALSYSREPSFSLVLYVNQSTDAVGNAAMRSLTRELIDLTIANKGRFFLPYQSHYTGKQLLAAYPEMPAFLAAKQQHDPEGLFSSTWYRAVRMLAAT